MKEKTLIIIKPNAISHCSEIWAMIKNAGFIVQEVKKVIIPLQVSEALHSIQPIFVPLSDFVFENECMVAVLEKDNAVNDFLNLIGDRNPAKAKSGTIRALFGDPKFFDLLQSEIVVYGSSTLQNAKSEIEFFYEQGLYYVR